MVVDKQRRQPSVISATLQLLVLWCLWQSGIAGEIYLALWSIAPKP